MSPSNRPCTSAVTIGSIGRSDSQNYSITITRIPTAFFKARNPTLYQTAPGPSIRGICRSSHRSPYSFQIAERSLRTVNVGTRLMSYTDCQKFCPKCHYCPVAYQPRRNDDGEAWRGDESPLQIQWIKALPMEIIAHPRRSPGGTASHRKLRWGYPAMLLARTGSPAIGCCF